VGPIVWSYTGTWHTEVRLWSQFASCKIWDSPIFVRRNIPTPQTPYNYLFLRLKSPHTYYHLRVSSLQGIVIASHHKPTGIVITGNRHQSLIIGHCHRCGLVRRRLTRVDTLEILCLSDSRDDDDCFYYYSWRNNVVIAFGTLAITSFPKTPFFPTNEKENAQGFH